MTMVCIFFFASCRPDAAQFIPLITLLVAVVASLSGPGGATLRTFDYTSGALIVEQRLHKPESARLLEPDHTGASIAFVSSTSASESTDLIVLTEGHVVRKLDSAGKELWKWVSPDQTYDLALYRFMLS